MNQISIINMMPKIVTSNLVVNLDAGNRNSYSGSGTTWFDISGNSNNGNLINGPTYSSSNDGGFIFDGSDDYVRINPTNTSSQVTLNFWVKITNSPTDYIGLINRFNGVNFNRNRLLIQANLQRLVFEPIINGVDYTIVSNSFPSILNKYTMCTMTWDGANVLFYINGNSVMSTPYTLTGTLTSGTTKPTIGLGSDNVYYYNGSIYNVLIYNRALNPQEIIQNYNALKNRYI